MPSNKLSVWDGQTLAFKFFLFVFGLKARHFDQKEFTGLGIRVQAGDIQHGPRLRDASLRLLRHKKKAPEGARRHLSNSA